MWSLPHRCRHHAHAVRAGRELYGRAEARLSGRGEGGGDEHGNRGLLDGSSPRQRTRGRRVAGAPAGHRRARRTAKMPRMRVISIEDHFWTADIATAIGALRNPDAASGTPLQANLADLGERRLAAMDEAGIDLLGHQPYDAGRPAPRSRHRHPAGARGQRRPGARGGRAPGSLRRLRHASYVGARGRRRRTGARGHRAGVPGAMVNGHTDGRFLDDPAFDVLLDRFERLGTVLYLHPAEPCCRARRLLPGPQPGGELVPQRRRVRLARGDRAAPAAHGARGRLRSPPAAAAIIGLMGEMLPFMLARVDDNLPPAVSGLDRLPSEYILVQRPHHDQRPVHHPAAAVRADGLRRRSRAVLGRLALRAQHRRPAPARHRAPEPRRPRPPGAWQRRGTPSGGRRSSGAAPGALALVEGRSGSLSAYTRQTPRSLNGGDSCRVCRLYPTKATSVEL